MRGIPNTVCTVFFHFQLSIVLTVICPSLCVLRYCVCYIHEEFNRMLQVLKKDSMVAHENCKCTCTFCALGGCKCVFETDMDMYWFMRHVLCAPDKLHSQTSRNLFPPRYNIPLLFSVCTSFNLPFFPLCAFSCLEGNCKADSPCFYSRTGTIFQCPNSKLFSDTEQITFEQSLNEDITATSYATDPLLDGRDSMTFHGAPPPKRIKRIWKKITKSKKEFSTRLFELAPDTFQHHQLELVQREELPIHIQSITPQNGLIVGWADYPENASIIDPQEQQSDYYDRYYYAYLKQTACCLLS